MIRQIARIGVTETKSFVNRFKIRSAFGAKTVAHLADPVIRFAARVDMFGNYRTRTFKALFRYSNSFRRAFRDVDIQKRVFGQAFDESLFRDFSGDFCRFGKIVIAIGDETESQVPERLKSSLRAHRQPFPNTSRRRRDSRRD